MPKIPLEAKFQVDPENFLDDGKYQLNKRLYKRRVIVITYLSCVMKHLRVQLRTNVVGDGFDS